MSPYRESKPAPTLTRAAKHVLIPVGGYMLPRVPMVSWPAAILGLLLGAVACGGGFSDADTKSSTDAARAEMALERLCADTSDGGVCQASQVRALERAARCANASMLARHGQPLPNGADTGCKP